MKDLTNNPTPDEDFHKLFEGVIGLEKQPNMFTLVATLWSDKRNLPVSGFKLGMPWLGEKPIEISSISAMRKFAKDFLFYFDERPRIMIHITKRVRKRGKPATLEIYYSGSIPYHLIDEL